MTNLLCGIGYKLFRERRDGSIGPLFINRSLRIPLHEWLPAEDHPTKGYAHRPGWHIGDAPLAPHLKNAGRVWYVVEYKNGYYFPRPAHQGSVWIIAQSLKVLGKHQQEEQHNG